jgi:CRISPR-associated protein (TIGR03986 family)
MTLPQHVDPQAADRRARAPYNFVPLPEVVVPATELPPRDRYDLERFTGVIHCTLTTETPLYTRAALEPREYGKVEGKNKDNFFYVDPTTHAPVIPGSSLRGMLRNLVEIITYSKPQPVTDRQLFFRTVDVSSVGKAYGARMAGGDAGTTGNYPLAKAGYMELRGYTYFIRPAQELEDTQFYRVTEQIARRIIPGLYEMARKKTRANGEEYWAPNGGYQWKRLLIWFRPVPPTHPPESRQLFADVTEMSCATTCPGEGWMRGAFVASGWVPSKAGGKRRHWIVGPPVEDDDQLIELHERDVDAYDDLGAGLTQAIRDMKMSVLPEKEGVRIPCFYTFWEDSEGTQRVAFGHTAMFRIPYEWSPRDLLPDHLRNSKVTDIAEAIFGWVDDRKGRQIAGRVYVGDAHIAGTPERLFEVDPQQPPIRSLLSGPKPTTFQHYLTQDTEESDKLHHYGGDQRGKTTLRGHKLYWHKDDQLKRSDLYNTTEDANPSQYTHLRPVAKGVTFAFDVRFENLTASELGALLWVLQTGDKEAFRLKVGMGKPLGLGTIRTHAKLALSQRDMRYRQVLAEWEDEATPGTTDFDRFIKDFEAAIWERLPAEAKGDAKNFRSLARIQALGHLLHWHGPDPNMTRYMDMKAKEYQNRPVLPTPAEVMRLAPPRPLPRARLPKQEDAIVEAVVLSVEGAYIVVDLGEGKQANLQFDQLPESIRDQKQAKRSYPVDSTIRVRVEHTKTGKARVTAKGVQQ